MLVIPPQSGRNTYWLIPNLRQPSRLVVFRRSSMWKKGTGEVESVCGAPPGIVATTASTVHDGFASLAEEALDAVVVSISSSGHRRESQLTRIPINMDFPVCCHPAPRLKSGSDPLHNLEENECGEGSETEEGIPTLRATRFTRNRRVVSVAGVVWEKDGHGKRAGGLGSCPPVNKNTTTVPGRHSPPMTH